MVGGGSEQVQLWEVSTGKRLRVFQAFSGAVFSPDSKTLVSGVSSKSLKIWDVMSGAELKSFDCDTQTVNSSLSSNIAFSPDGNTLISLCVGRTIKLWDVSSGKELRSFRGENFVLSPDGRILVIKNKSGMASWDVASGLQLKKFRGGFHAFAFSPDGKVLAANETNSTIRLWDVASATELKTLEGHSGNVKVLTFSPDGKTLASGSLDATAKLWDVDSGNSLATLISLDEKDWIVVTPDGLFDGSPSAWNKIIWRFSPNLYDFAPVEAFFSDFYYPGLLPDVFARKNPRAPSDIAQKDRRQPQLKLTPAETQSNVMPSARNLKVKIDVSEALAGAQDVRLFRNGSLVKVWHGDVLKGRSNVTLDATIPIVAGPNNLTAYAFNHDNVKSSDATLVVTGAESLKRKGTAYVLAVGVNEYSNTQYNLAYAVADAKDFAGEYKREQEKLGNYARVEVIALNDKDATKGNILKALTDLSTKVQPEDSVTIFFAGHGTAEKNRFYLIPHDLGYAGSRTQLDAASLKSILAHSISDEELEVAVESIDAGQMLLVIDACNSGQALEAEEKRRGPMNSKGLAQLAYEKGMYILTAAQSYQAAKETAKLGHGFLTYALVEEGLKTSLADREPKDGQVLLREWLDFATERVPQMQQDDLLKRQLTQLTQEKKKTGDTGEKDNIQRPRVFYRRETEPRPFVVARP